MDGEPGAQDRALVHGARDRADGARVTRREPLDRGGARERGGGRASGLVGQHLYAPERHVPPPRGRERIDVGRPALIQIGRAHVWTPVTVKYRMPTSA